MCEVCKDGFLGFGFWWGGWKGSWIVCGWWLGGGFVGWVCYCVLGGGKGDGVGWDGGKGDGMGWEC